MPVVQGLTDVIMIALSNRNILHINGLCAGNSPVTRGFGVTFICACTNSWQCRRPWFETPLDIVLFTSVTRWPLLFLKHTYHSQNINGVQEWFWFISRLKIDKKGAVRKAKYHNTLYINSLAICLNSDIFRAFSYPHRPFPWTGLTTTQAWAWRYCWNLYLWVIIVDCGM